MVSSRYRSGDISPINNFFLISAAHINVLSSVYVIHKVSIDACTSYIFSILFVALGFIHLTWFRRVRKCLLSLRINHRNKSTNSPVPCFQKVQRTLQLPVGKPEYWLFFSVKVLWVPIFQDTRFFLCCFVSIFAIRAPLFY